VNRTDLAVLEDIAIDELTLTSCLCSLVSVEEIAEPKSQMSDLVDSRESAVGRLEHLGLVQRTRTAPQRVVITEAGVEALAYLCVGR
jgi:hypothetical protein